jgi:prevent-host-death family protein
MIKVNASEARNKFLRLLDSLVDNPEGIIITRRGVPVARILPFAETKPNRFGVCKGMMKVKGDIINTDFSDDWEMMH